MRELRARVQDNDVEQGGSLLDVLPKRIWYCGAWRTPEGVERKREADRNNKRKNWDAPNGGKSRRRVQRDRGQLADKEKERARALKYYERNKEQQNAKRNANRKANLERERETARRCYRAKRAERLAKIYDARDRRNPARLIRRAIAQLKLGELGHLEFVEAVSRAVAEAHGNDRD